MRAWRLVGGAYVEAGSAVGDAPLELPDQFTVRVVPQDLLHG